MPIYEFRCEVCGYEVEKLKSLDDFIEPCPRCKEKMRKLLPSRVHTTEWGQSRYIRSLDQTFGSRSELESYKKLCHVEDAGDRVHGARNESHLNQGKVFSLPK